MVADIIEEINDNVEQILGDFNNYDIYLKQLLVNDLKKKEIPQNLEESITNATLYIKQVLKTINTFKPKINDFLENNYDLRIIEMIDTVNQIKKVDDDAVNFFGRVLNFELIRNIDYYKDIITSLLVIIRIQTEFLKKQSTTVKIYSDNVTTISPASDTITNKNQFENLENR